MTIIHSSCICLFIFNLIWRSISLSVPTRQLFYVFYDNNTYLLYLLQLLQLWKSFFLFLCQLCVFMTIIHSCICVFIHNCSQQQNPVLLFVNDNVLLLSRPVYVPQLWLDGDDLYIVVYCCSHSALCDGTIFGICLFIHSPQLRRICVHVTVVWCICVSSHLLYSNCLLSNMMNEYLELEMLQNNYCAPTY